MRAAAGWSASGSSCARDFPRAVRREMRFVRLAALLFFGPLLVLTFAIPQHPDFAYVVLPAEVLDSVQEMYGEAAKTLGRKREADTDVAMFGFYIFNNVRIGFQTFASGLLFGLGAIFYLLYNGVFIGAITGYIVHAGSGHQLLLVHVRAQRVRARRHLPVGRRRPQARLCAGRARAR